MTLYQTTKEAVFGKLFPKEGTDNILKKNLPWSYKVDFTFFTDDSDMVRSGSQTYYGVDSDLHNDVIVRWYYDNGHLDAEVQEVTLTFNSLWSSTPTHTA